MDFRKDSYAFNEFMSLSESRGKSLRATENNHEVSTRRKREDASEVDFGLAGVPFAKLVWII